MSNEQVESASTAEATPESLMEPFKGISLIKMVIATIIFHIVIIVGTSVPYLKKELLGADVTKMTKEQKIEKAVAEAASSLKKIAAENGLSPTDISNSFSPGGARAMKTAAPAPAADAKGTPAPVTPVAKAPAVKPDAKPVTSDATPARPESKIEKDLKKAVDGPKIPASPSKDDIF